MITAVIGLVAPTEGEQCIDVGAGVGAGVVVAARTSATVTAAEPTPFLASTTRDRGASSQPSRSAC
jgi:protein-L-isoaspartate O-methyltransferase